MTTPADYITRQWTAQKQFSSEANFFFEALSAAEFHWFFVQGLTALRAELYLPGVSALLNGIEASLRVTMHQVTADATGRTEPSPYKVLSNVLLSSAAEAGIPVYALAFPDERDFRERLASPKGQRRDVEVVRMRNNICHGNIFEFVASKSGEADAYFTPDALRNVSAVLLGVSFQWAKSLGDFRRAQGLLHYGSTPPVPSTPLIVD
ncbi:MAG TPA: hypothetical protein VGM87_07080 [Roseomonas sp.]